MNFFIIWLSTLNSTVKLLPVDQHPFDCLALVQVKRKALPKQQQPNDVGRFRLCLSLKHAKNDKSSLFMYNPPSPLFYLSLSSSFSEFVLVNCLIY